MRINGIEIPSADNRGRAFPHIDTGPHFAGPAIINGQLMVVKMWRNVSSEGREYFRLVFETLEESNLPITE